jgi:hypothetical protein
MKNVSSFREAVGPARHVQTTISDRISAALIIVGCGMFLCLIGSTVFQPLLFFAVGLLFLALLLDIVSFIAAVLEF